MKDLFTNKWLWIPLSTWLLVQLVKLITEVVKASREGRNINFRRIIGAGGMPSAHTACIVSLATSIGLSDGIGFGSPIFALATVLAFVVMYDAAGVRRAAGKQARVLNKLIENEGKDTEQVKLVELLGHTPIEVFVGCLVGILIGVIFSLIWDLRA